MPGWQKPVFASKNRFAIRKCLQKMSPDFAVIDTQINIKFLSFGMGNEQNGIYYFEKAAIISILSILVPSEYTLFTVRIYTGGRRIMFWYCRRINVRIFKITSFHDVEFHSGGGWTCYLCLNKNPKTNEQKLEVQQIWKGREIVQ